MRSFKRLVLIFITLLTLSVSLTGCWDDHPVDTRSLVLGMGFYPGSKPRQITVYFSIPTPSGLASSSASSSGSSSSGPPLITLKGTGYSLGQAFVAAQAQTNRDLYLGHTVFLVLSTKLSATDLSTIINSMARIGTLDKTPFVAATPEPFTKVFGTIPQEHFPALYYEELFSCSNCQQLHLGVRLWTLMNRTATPGVDLVLPALTIKDGNPTVNTVALYRGMNFVTFFNHQETTGYAMAAGLSKKTPLYLPDEWHASLDFIQAKKSLSTKVKGHHITAIDTIHVTATLESIGTTTENAHQLSAISQRAATLLSHEALASLRLSQKEDVDVLGVGRHLSWVSPREFSQFSDWHKEYPQVDFKVDTVVTINKMGDVR